MLAGKASYDQLTSFFLPLDEHPQAKSMPQGDAKDPPKAPQITAETAVVDFRKMTAQDIMNRHRAISHQVSSAFRYSLAR
jgi:hypothetical protein